MNMVRRGFSLPEMIVAVAIISLIVGIVALFARDIFVFSGVYQADLNTHFQSRKLLRGFITEVRSISQSSDGSYAIASATENEFIFFVDTDGDDLRERKRYFFEDGELQVGTIIPSGSPLAYDVDDETVLTIITDVVNESGEPVFEYFDTNYDGTTDPIASPVTTSQVRHVRVTVIVDEDPNVPPSERVFVTQATMRNLKDNL